MNKTVSVIVPVYKVEDLLNRCVDSILNQDYKDLEIILVDDGSPDRCGQICDQYKETDNRIKVIHKLNGGLSSARNAGLDICTGTYVTFIDSDDWISDQFISALVRSIEENKSDIAISDTVCVYENSDVTKSFGLSYNPKNCYTNLEAYNVMFLQHEFDNSAWGKLYKKELFRNLRFTPGILYEDFDIMYRILYNTKLISYCSNVSYFYFQRSGSIMHESYTEKDNVLLSIANDMLSFINKNVPEVKEAAIRRYVVSELIILNKTGYKHKYTNTICSIYDDLSNLKRDIFKNPYISLKSKCRIFLFLILGRKRNVKNS